MKYGSRRQISGDWMKPQSSATRLCLCSSNNVLYIQNIYIVTWLKFRPTWEIYLSTFNKIKQQSARGNKKARRSFDRWSNHRSVIRRTIRRIRLGIICRLVFQSIPTPVTRQILLTTTMGIKAFPRNNFFFSLRQEEDALSLHKLAISALK